tara:strand:+ start:150 stop:923 length:774 start_codon:yes stop_codon:yes gene_type:complete
MSSCEFFEFSDITDVDFEDLEKPSLKIHEIGRILALKKGLEDPDSFDPSDIYLRINQTRLHKRYVSGRHVGPFQETSYEHISYDGYEGVAAVFKVHESDRKNSTRIELERKCCDGSMSLVPLEACGSDSCGFCDDPEYSFGPDFDTSKNPRDTLNNLIESFGIDFEKTSDARMRGNEDVVYIQKSDCPEEYTTVCVLNTVFYSVTGVYVHRRHNPSFMNSVKRIQDWWKEIYWNPRHRVGIKVALRGYDEYLDGTKE